MRALLALAVGAGLTACATTGHAPTPAQALFGGFGAYSAALTAAATYAEAPGADAKVVSVLAAANRKAQPAVAFTKAYRTCLSGAATAQGKPCVSFDFSATSLLSQATLLRNAAAALAER